MPLDRYGVLSGTLTAHHRDRPDAQGRWFHVNLEVDAPDGRYRSAVDVDSKDSATGVRWSVVRVPAAALGPVAVLDPGYRDLDRSPDSGALDFLRHPALGDRLTWTAGDNLAAATALEAVLRVGAAVLVFGEPFTEGLGIHNVHQNQGDPYGSQWWPDNGIWQDGATLVRRPDGDHDAFLSRFSTQADRTDEGGHPAVLGQVAAGSGTGE